MHITKQKLKKLINEEIKKMIREREAWPGKSGTLHHGIEWFEAQDRIKQNSLLDNAHRDRVPSGHYAGSFDKSHLNDWLWKHYVPRDIKQGK